MRGNGDMCGIIGYLDKHGGADRPIGRTLLGMLEALSCRGPDSAGVAVFGPARAGWHLNIKLPERQPAEKTSAAIVETIREIAGILHHKIEGAYLRLEIDGA